MFRSLLLLLLFPMAHPAAAQDAGRSGEWSLTVGGDGIRFGRAARDTAVPADQSADLRPSGRMGLRASLAHSLGEWRAQLELGWAQGDAEARNQAVAIRDRTLDLSRYRLGAGLERAVARLGTGELALGLMPTVDLWRAGGESRVRLGLEARLGLRVPLGRVALENRISLGFSGSPLDEADLTSDFERHSLKSLAFGVGLRLPL